MKFYTTDDLHINPDAKEAVLFALLANECVCGEKINVGKGRNKIPSVTMGKISFPVNYLTLNSTCLSPHINATFPSLPTV
jgi:hypothetical protein